MNKTNQTNHEKANTVLRQIIIDRVGGRRQKVGVLVGMLGENDRIKIGWCRANINAGDKFDKDKGIKLAMQRSQATVNVPAPRSIHGNLERFAKRCHKYFEQNQGIYANWH